MKTEVFLNLLEDPKGVQKIGVDELRELALAYPYSQVIQLLYGIRLRYSSEHLFNQQLGRAAALSNDRSVLFELFEDKPKVQARAVTPAKLEITESETISRSPKPKEETIQSGLSTAIDNIADKGEDKKEEPAAPEKVNEAQPKEAEPKPKVAYLDAKPAGMENLSPQDRVKAILERNRQLRQQFDDQKANSPSAEKLFSAPSDQAKPDVKSEESKLESADLDKTELNKTARSADDINHPEEIASPKEGQIDKVETPADEVKVNENDQANNPHQEKAEEKSPYEDHPIDISDLIRRRYRSRFETPAFQDEEESSEAEEETVSEEAPALTAADAPIESSSSASEEDESDMGMSVRIRDIRARLERLKKEDALSEEEMEALMEEHQKLEELLSLLPAEKDHVFEVEVSQEEEPTEDTSSESEEIIDSQEQEEEGENDSEPMLESDSSSEDSKADPVKEEEAAEPKAEEEAEGETEVEEEKTEVEEDTASETEEKSQPEEPKPAAEPKATDEKNSVESASSESEKEPALEDEISRIEALAERLRVERQVKTISKQKFSTKADARIESGESAPKAEGKPAVETSESNEAASDLASQDEVGTSADTGAESEKETEQESADKEGIKGSSVEEEAADLVQALEEDIASVEEASTEVSHAIDEKEDLIESTSEDAHNIEVSSLEQDTEEAQVEAENEAEVEQEVEESSVEKPNLSKDSEDQEETTEPQAEEEKTETESDTESDATLEADDQEKLRTEPVQEDTAETVAKDESSAAEKESAEEDDDSPSFGTLLKRLKSRGGANTPEEEGQSEKAEEKQAETPILKSEIAEKIDLIDAFVEKLPDLKKRKPSKADIVNTPEVKKEEEPASESEEVTLVTETLAKVYIKQGHFKKAIQAYEILRLKYPEKSSFFASRILEIKKLSNSKK